MFRARLQDRALRICGPYGARPSGRADCTEVTAATSRFFRVPVSAITGHVKSELLEFVNWCKCFNINRSSRCGRVAQLGEHLLCKQGVAGSIPATSTNHLHFNNILSKIAEQNSCYLGRGSGDQIHTRPPLFSFALLTTRKLAESVNTSAFVGTNPTDQFITSGLPITRARSPGPRSKRAHLRELHHPCWNDARQHGAVGVAWISRFSICSFHPSRQD